MYVVESSFTLNNDLGTRIRAFVEKISARSANPVLSDHSNIELQRSLDGNPSPGYIAVLASSDGVASGYAQAAPTGTTIQVEIATEDHGDDSSTDTATIDLLDSVLDLIAASQPTPKPIPVVWWVDDPSDAVTTRARQRGLSPKRTLFEMRRLLPHPDRSKVQTRSFHPGSDDEAWLIVNNRAFAHHDEQGGWSVATLQSRFAEPWFDPDGFRLFELDGRLAAFCWTKIHHESGLQERVGEIYAIAVDPDFGGRGLGTQLALAGLESLSERGITTANLYVDADNAAAVALYRRLGFTVHRTRQAFYGSPTIGGTA